MCVFRIRCVWSNSATMKWKVIRLELASNWEFPKGSAGRSYLIRLPLTDDGAIDSQALEIHPARATVRRYWPNQADMVGYLLPTLAGYAIRYETNGYNPNAGPNAGGNPDQILFRPGADVISVGDEIFLTEPDGKEARFRIADIQ